MRIQFTRATPERCICALIGYNNGVIITRNKEKGIKKSLVQKQDFIIHSKSKDFIVSENYFRITFTRKTQYSV